MHGTFVANLTHYLDEGGRLPDDLTGPARTIAIHLGSIVAGITATGVSSPARLTVRCRRRPGRRPCPGMIVATIEPGGDEIAWICPTCGDEGLLSGWQGTIWDHRRPETSPAPRGREQDR